MITVSTSSHKKKTARDPKLCGGGKKIMYYNYNIDDDVNVVEVVDDVDDDGDVVDDDADDDDDEDAEIYTSPCHKKHFARAGAVEMHMELSQEEFCAEIYSENATG
jgi:hypothetical protein